MMLQRSYGRYVFLAALVIALIVPQTCSAKKGGKDRPLKGTGEGLISFVPGGAILEVVGNASHVGRFERFETITFTGPGTFTAEMTFTAANGDELDAIVTGAFISPTAAAGTYEFTGGTGRFTDATGTADFVATTFDGINVLVDFEGTISY